MTPTRIVQRSPDIGIGIRLKRIVEVAKPVAAPVVPAVDPSPPWWWGWFDDDRARCTALEATFPGFASVPPMPAQTGYWPGLWVAVVDNATAVRWQVVFTPKIWSGGKVVWEDVPVLWSLPPDLPQAPSALFAPATVTIPEYLTLNEVSYYYYNYWAAAQISVTGGRDDIPLPTVVAAGNTLTVVQDTRSMSGSLLATAFVGDVSVGSVTLELIYDAIATGGSSPS